MKKVLCVAAFFTMSFMGCDEAKENKEETTKTEKLENVVRVFMHDSSSYTLACLDNSTKEIIMRYVKIEPYRSPKFGFVGDVKIFADIPLEKPMWAEIQRYYRGGVLSGIALIIHVHSEKNIDGGDWEKRVQEGKFTKVIKGHTSVIK